MVSQVPVIRVTEKPSIELVRSEMNLRGTTFPQLLLSTLKLFIDRVSAILGDRREYPRTGRRHFVSSALSPYRPPRDRSHYHNKSTEYEDTAPAATPRSPVTPWLARRHRIEN